MQQYIIGKISKFIGENLVTTWSGILPIFIGYWKLSANQITLIMIKF